MNRLRRFLLCFWLAIESCLACLGSIVLLKAAMTAGWLPHNWIMCQLTGGIGLVVLFASLWSHARYERPGAGPLKSKDPSESPDGSANRL